MNSSRFTLTRTTFGKLTLIAADGQQHDNVAPVRAFPVQAPQQGIALVSSDGKEVAWIEQLSDLAAPERALIEEELASREFMPEIGRIAHVSSYATPCTWSVSTNRGDTSFVLRGEEDIRRIGTDSLLISDIHGIHYLVRDSAALDKHSKKILDRFL